MLSGTARVGVGGYFSRFVISKIRLLKSTDIIEIPVAWARQIFDKPGF